MLTVYTGVCLSSSGQRELRGSEWPVEREERGRADAATQTMWDPSTMDMVEVSGGQGRMHGLPQGRARTAAALVSLWRARRGRVRFSFGGRSVAGGRCVGAGPHEKVGVDTALCTRARPEALHSAVN